jgi:hypothetical protein
MGGINRWTLERISFVDAVISGTEVDEDMLTTFSYSEFEEERRATVGDNGEVMRWRRVEVRLT